MLEDNLIWKIFQEHNDTVLARFHLIESPDADTMFCVHDLRSVTPFYAIVKSKTSCAIWIFFGLLIKRFSSNFIFHIHF